MALVACRECGAEVSSRAPTCPKCGIAHPGGAGQLVILRYSGITGGMYGVQVVIDGKVAGEVKNGGSITIDLLAGPHQVEVSGGGLSKSIAVQITDGQATRYQVYFSALGILGGGLNLKPA